MTKAMTPGPALVAKTAVVAAAITPDVVSAGSEHLASRPRHLFLDFQHDGVVRTAAFTLSTTEHAAEAPSAPTEAEAPDSGHGGHGGH